MAEHYVHITPANWCSRRDGRRYRIKEKVDVLLLSQRFAVGELIDISRSGAAVRTYSPLSVGETYTFATEHFGTMSCRVIRSFGVNQYAIAFDLGEDQKISLERRIVAMLGEGLATEGGDAEDLADAG